MERERIWDAYLTPRDREVYGLAGYGRRAGPGRRPAVLVVDANYNFLGFGPKPIREAVAEVRTACGEEGWKAVPAIRSLLEFARAVPVPVLFSTGVPRLSAEGMGGWALKNQRAAAEEARRPPSEDLPDGNEFPPEIAPLPGEVVVRKEKPSPFFGTPLVSHLIRTGVDTLLVVGGTTSGCVRAAVIDAFALNLRVLVVEEGCFDRGEVSHAINLFDMHQKYADVISLSETTAYLEGLAGEEKGHD